MLKVSHHSSSQPNLFVCFLLSYFLFSVFRFPFPYFSLSFTGFIVSSIFCMDFSGSFCVVLCCFGAIFFVFAFFVRILRLGLPACLFYRGFAFFFLSVRV
ncbi:hypothetical protein EX30DRAFT_250815 [Ascodesmis nigricans]|uniref:Uncharacterized protein n=1 Tax=Ascodesmis nigricans TaxID=341454 RepID=A0A4S2MYH8_9PEZI|nr:hypothetical protein EX30DRAFT_250815 [Ascodesmis nigricans]